MADEYLTRLREGVLALGPLCAGIDPSREQLMAWQRDDDASGLEFAALATLEAVVGVAPVIKAQVAFYERFGSAGYAVLERLISEAGEAGLLVIADAKRGDVGSTNDAYGEAWLGDSPLAVDAVTVHPYLGLGAMEPIFARARSNGRGAYVVVASSNDDGRVIQGARTDGDEVVEDYLLREVAADNAASGLGAIGAVLGATRTRPRFDLGRLGGSVLVPGVGAQGATVSDVGSLVSACVRGSVVVNVSRALAAAGPDRRQLRDTARRWNDDLRAVLL
jgi:orotidine-5'-phosphate decarboxylase